MCLADQAFREKMSERLPVHGELSTSRSDQPRSKDTYRRQAGIPLMSEFPHVPTAPWKAAAPVIPPLYSYNPIVHTVDKFMVEASTGKMKQYKTMRDSPELEASAKDALRMNRRKGVLEYADMTRPSGERWNPDYHKVITTNPNVFRHTPTAFSRLYDVAVRNHDNPFRVGK